MKSTNKLPLSIALIAHNEERNIDRCLKSVAGIASEIVLVINDCTDRTVEIAKSYGAKVHTDTWHGHRDQKNIALEKTTQLWVLAIDADEELSDELREEIVEFIQADDPAYAGAYFPRKVWFLGRWITHGDWYPDHSLRLIRKDKGRWGGSREHDSMKLEGKAKKLQADLHHYSNPTLNSQIEKINYFSDIFLQRQLDANKQWSLSHAILRPPWRFFRAYFLRRGFLDGFAGLYAAILSSFAAFVRHSRLYEYKTTPEVQKQFKK